MNHSAFGKTKLLLPNNVDLSKWSVIACDQYTSDAQGYWLPLAHEIGDAPSTLNMILPEAFLPAGHSAAELASLAERVAGINATMLDYLQKDLFHTYEDCYVYIERTLPDGRIRRGLLGQLDLEQYSYTTGATPPVRPTEGTVESRLPIRAEIRREAPLELPHILVLIDDPNDTIIGGVARQRDTLPQLYDTPLSRGGGRVAGWLVAENGEEIPGCLERVDLALEQLPRDFQIAVGDGNHSLAAAKLCWEGMKVGLSEAERRLHPARFALVELENIWDPALTFEPIHRVLFDVDASAFLDAIQVQLKASRSPLPDAIRVDFLTGGLRDSLWIPCGAVSVVGILQPFLDDWIARFGGQMDYIHGAAQTIRLASQTGAIGFLLPAMDKRDLFPTICASGVLPRKTFSMGEAEEKRYYLECRAIR